MTSTLGHGFLTVPPTTRERQHLYDNDVHEVGYVMNLSLLWAQLPDAKVTWESLLMLAVETAGLTFRQRALLVSACAATLGDAYCSLAWGNRLVGASDPALAAAVVIGDDSRLGPDERVLTSWARAITRDPNSTTRRMSRPFATQGTANSRSLRSRCSSHSGSRSPPSTTPLGRHPTVSSSTPSHRHYVTR